MLKAACCIAASVLLFLPAAYWLYSVTPVNRAQQAVVAEQFAWPDACRPEPGERVLYLSGIVFLPLCVFGLLFAWRRWEGRLRPMPGLIWGLEIAVIVALYIVAWLTLLGNDYYHLRPNQFFIYPLLAVPLLPAVLLTLRWDWGGRRLARPLLHLVAFGLAGVICLGSVFNDKGRYTGCNHFNATFFPMVQVYQGKALLIDCPSQYGLYPHLLQPLFALTGLTVFSFTLVMGLLSAASFAALWWFLARACENKSAALIGFAALLFNTWFSFVRHTGLDFYFQYFPIRFVFPALMVLLAWRQLRRPSRRLYWGLLIFLAVGVLWNLDAGLPTLLTWTMTLCFAELFGADWRSGARRIAGHLAATCGVLAATVALYSAVIRLRFGAFPDCRQLLEYQRLYFVAGFYKLPMSPPTTWVLVGLVYLAGFAYAAVSLTQRKETPRAKIVFLLSVLGVGLSSYYQGRSHPRVLLLAWWPCHLLIALFFDDLLLRVKEMPARLLPWFATVVLAWFLAGSAYSLIPEVGFIGDAIAANYRAMSDPKIPPQRQEDVALLKRLVPPGEKVLLASRYAAFLHLVSHRSALNPASLPDQMVLMEEFRRLNELLAQSPSTKVLFDKNVFMLEDVLGKDRGLRALVATLQEKYEVAGATKAGLLFARRLSEEPHLENEDGVVLQISAREDASLASFGFNPISTKPPWTLELLVKPDAVQGPNAALAGNHGYAMTGFVIYQETPGVWALAIGDAKTYQTILRFNLRSGEWNYLALVCTEDAFTLYLDGAPIASKAVPGLKIAESPLPFQIGNWVNNDRPFSGDFKEFRLLNRALAPHEIAAVAESVRGKLH